MHYGEIRSLLHHPPTEFHWLRICNFVTEDYARDPDEVRGRLLPYLENHLRHWPDAMRKCPHNWLEPFLEGEDFAPCSLVRHFSGVHVYVPLSGDQIFASPHVQRVTHLTMRSQPYCHELIEGLVRSTTPPELESLSLCNSRLGDRTVALLTRCEALSSLRTLDLSANHISNRGVTQLAEAHVLRNLERLVLAYNPLDPSCRLILARSPYLGEVEVDWGLLG